MTQRRILRAAGTPVLRSNGCRPLPGMLAQQAKARAGTTEPALEAVPCGCADGRALPGARGRRQACALQVHGEYRQYP